MSRLTFHLHAAGVVAPGFHSLADLRAACRRGSAPVAEGPMVLPSPGQLPANERRRATQVVRLTLCCIEQALASCPFPANALRTVFATDEGTGEVCQQMLEALATTRQISPLLFSNSVLNAPSGYFSIAFRSRQPATVVSAGVESFASGLLCAAIDAATTKRPVLLVAYDPAMTPPVDELLPIAEPTATAWVLSANTGEAVPALATFTLQQTELEASIQVKLPSWLPSRWSAHSSARGLAALGLLEADGNATCRLPLGGMVLTLQRVRRVQ